MVRLKDNRSNKTFAQFQIISIPYGAIKRNAVSNSVLTSILFQFLMVRLKVCRYLKCFERRRHFNSLWCD